MVTAGQVLVRLDGTFISSELAIIESQFYEAMARRVRLTDERDSSTRLTVPAELEKAAAINPRLGNILDGQTRLFDARNNTMASYLEQLGKQERQLTKQILGIDIEKKISVRPNGAYRRRTREHGGFMGEGASLPRLG